MSNENPVSSAIKFYTNKMSINELTHEYANTDKNIFLPV